MGSQDQLKGLLPALLHTTMKTLKIKRKQEGVPDNQAMCPAPTLTFFCSSIQYLVYILCTLNRQICSRLYNKHKGKLFYQT